MSVPPSENVLDTIDIPKTSSPTAPVEEHKTTPKKLSESELAKLEKEKVF